MLNPSYIILRIQRLESRVILEEVAHYEPPHQDLSCLQTQLFLSLGLKELMRKEANEMEEFFPLKVNSIHLKSLLSSNES